MITLHYSEEVLSYADVAPKEGKGAAARREGVLELLKRKAAEQAPVEAPAVAAEEGAGPPDLMAALEEAMLEVRKNR